MSRQSKAFLLVFDLIIFSLIVGLMFTLRTNESALIAYQAFGFWFTTSFLLLGNYIFGTYDIEPGGTKASLVGRLAVAAIISSVMIIFVNYLGGKDRAGLFERGVLLGSMAIFVCVASVSRVLLLNLVNKVVEKQMWLVIASQEKALQFKRDLDKYNFKSKVQYLFEDKVDQLKEEINKNWSKIVLAVDHFEASHELTEVLMTARLQGKNVLDLVQFYETNFKKLPIYHLGQKWFIFADGFRLLNNPMGLRLKRLGDIFVSFFLLLLLWPLMLLVAVVINLESRGGAIYSQVRTGKDGKDFRIYKFRSMRADAEKDGAQWASVKDHRITLVGAFIRKTRIDELPQLWNVLKGEMSFIGPRPERPQFNENLEKEIPFYQLRHLVRPGLTGWAQIMYPYGASIEDAREKLQYEMYYIKNYSLFLDIKILLKTIGVVLFGKGR